MDLSTASNKPRTFSITYGIARYLFAVLIGTSFLQVEASERATTLRVTTIDMPRAFPSGAAGQLTAADSDISTIVIHGVNTTNNARFYKSHRQQLSSFVTYTAPVEIAPLRFCFGYTVALSPNGRWLAVAGGQSAGSELHVIDLLADQDCSDTTKLMSLANEGRSVLRFNKNSTRLWVGVPYASFVTYGDGPSQGLTTEFGLGLNGQWATTRQQAGYLFGDQQAPNFNAGYGAALAFSSDTNVRAVLTEANKPVTAGYDRNPAVPTILLQRTGASDSLFTYSNPASASRVGTRLSMDENGTIVVHAATTKNNSFNDFSVNLHTFFETVDGWQRRDQNDLNVFDCFGDLPNIASSYDDPYAADTVISADGQRLALTISSTGLEGRLAYGLCLFSREGKRDWELLLEDSQTASNALRSAIGGFFSSALSPEPGKLQANDTLERVLIPHKDFAAVIELEWSEVVDNTTLPMWLLYEASKS